MAISDPASSPVIGASRTPVPRGSRWADSRGLAAQIIRFGGASLRFTAGCAAAPTSVTSRQATCSPLPRVPEGPRTASRRCQRVTVPGGATAAGGYGIPANRGRRAERRLGMSFGNLDNGARPRRPRATGRGTALACVGGGPGVLAAPPHRGAGPALRRRAGGGGTTFPARASLAGTTTSFPSGVRTAKEPVSASSRMPSTSATASPSPDAGLRQRITTRWPISAGVSRTSSRYCTPTTSSRAGPVAAPGTVRGATSMNAPRGLAVLECKLDRYSTIVLVGYRRRPQGLPGCELDMAVWNSASVRALLAGCPLS